MSNKVGEQLKEQKIGDLAVEEFMGLLLSVLDARRKEGDPRLLELSVKEFGEFMLDYMKTRAYQTASAETDTANRILTDWQAIHDVGAVSQPFHIRNEKDAKEFFDELVKFWKTDGKGEYVVAVAIKGEQGAYTRPKGDGFP